MEITPGLGPSSTPDAPTLPGAQRRVLHALAARDGRTVADLAQALELHANGVRRHLAALAEAGYASVDQAAPDGPGRPSSVYAITDAGRALLAGADAPLGGEYLAMAQAFAEYVESHAAAPAADARGIGRTWGRLLAERSAASPASAVCPAAATTGTAGTPETRVVRLLADLGFSPQPRRQGDIALRTCPLLDAAREHPSVLCEAHLGLVWGASAAYGGPDRGGELRAFAEPGACVLRLPGEPDRR